MRTSSWFSEQALIGFKRMVIIYGMDTLLMVGSENNYLSALLFFFT